jgi:DNA-binding response OmpR family regulator
VAHRILVVDDEYSNTEALAVLLAEEGYEVAVASNGREALLKLGEALPQLILTDHMMPVMNGMQLIRAVRGSHDHREVAILLMSGAPEPALGDEPAPYDGFLRKPFDLDELLERVKALLARPRA